MKNIPTRLHGLILLELEPGVDVFDDERGYFSATWNFQRLQERGVPYMFKAQMAASFSRRGVIRGIHAEPWDKLIHVASGRVYAAEVDLREGSPTFSQHEPFCLDRTKVLYVPAGFGNSFQALEDTHYLYMVSGCWRASDAYRHVTPFDPEVNIDWPISRHEQVVSDKDRAHPTLAQAYRNRTVA